MECYRANVPDVSPEQRTNVELIMRIRKLRWIGMEDEAELVQLELAARDIEPVDTVLAIPRETD